VDYVRAGYGARRLSEAVAKFCCVPHLAFRLHLLSCLAMERFLFRVFQCADLWACASESERPTLRFHPCINPQFSPLREAGSRTRFVDHWIDSEQRSGEIGIEIIMA
jgi:hypothetical protein